MVPSIQCTIQLQGDVNARYIAVAKNLRKQIRQFHATRIAEFETYAFPPVWVASDVDPAIMEELPTLVNDVHVKCELENGSLFIVNLSSAGQHAAGSNTINAQAFEWANRRFNVVSDSPIKFGAVNGRVRAPDCVIQSRPRGAGVYRRPGRCLHLMLIAFPLTL
jgi:hypothetical protein